MFVFPSSLFAGLRLLFVLKCVTAPSPSKEKWSSPKLSYNIFMFLKWHAVSFLVEFAHEQWSSSYLSLGWTPLELARSVRVLRVINVNFLLKMPFYKQRKRLRESRKSSPKLKFFWSFSELSQLFFVNKCMGVNLVNLIVDIEGLIDSRAVRLVKSQTVI